MHEFGLMQSVLEQVQETAREAGAERVYEIKLVIGEMREVLPEAMDFAFEALSPGTLCEGAHLRIRAVGPSSRCLSCGQSFEHDRFHWACPACDSLATEPLTGKELYIDSIEVDVPQ
ncbi:MAG: hydrogenase maturation nickel metallochaperone HypA [Coriobacteriales bacterium]|jgi:hydrogenase nickel incorporation protein HypA/HybF|nr:hydrogenase maturation nickel metallochaperone HypA [Coriobacteriales bacterium]